VRRSSMSWSRLATHSSNTRFEEFMMTTSALPAPSTRPGMGTILFPGGVAFRVWAPFATQGNGYWSVEVPGAGIGDEYQFVLHNGEQVLWHKNPYASEVVHSSGN